MINIAICGVNGRIGRTIYKALLSNQDYKIVFGVDKFGGNDFPFPCLNLLRKFRKI